MPSRNRPPDDNPSMLWVTVPAFFLLGVYFARKWWLARQLKVHGIGKGAPGFQTGVRRVRVTPEIAARLQRGEDVSPEEIAAASAKADAQEPSKPVIRDIVEVNETQSGEGMSNYRKGESKSAPTNEWIPETITNPKKRGKGKKK